MHSHRISFSGNIVKRGFWIYIWRIAHSSGVYYYVGRTGDSSSANAASPMSRMSAHFGHNPKGNALKRNLMSIDIDMEECDYDYYCFGPLIDEKASWDEHRKARDIAATVEVKVAQHLKAQGCRVIGQHQIKQKSLDPMVKQFTKEITEALDEVL